MRKTLGYKQAKEYLEKGGKIHWVEWEGKRYYTDEKDVVRCDAITKLLIEGIVVIKKRKDAPLTGRIMLIQESKQ